MTNRETTADHSFWTALRLGCAASRRVSGESSSRWVRSKVRKLYLRLREERDDALMAEGEEAAMFEQRTRELDEARTSIAELERERDYLSGYAADLATIDHVLDEHNAPHDCEDGVSLSPKRIRLLAEERDEARRELRALEWLAITVDRMWYGRDTGGIFVAITTGSELEVRRVASWAEAAAELGWKDDRSEPPCDRVPRTPTTLRDAVRPDMVRSMRERAAACYAIMPPIDNELGEVFAIMPSEDDDG